MFDVGQREAAALAAIEQDVNAVLGNLVHFEFRAALAGHVEREHLRSGDYEDTARAADDFGRGFIDQFGEIDKNEIVLLLDEAEELVIVCPHGIRPVVVGLG